MPTPVLPENAPFNPAQRAWLNGFFAGLLGMGGTPVPLPTLGDSDTPANGISAGAEPVVEEEEDFPWHDPTLTLEERLPLAEGKPFELVLMSAMAQQDCGSCGYLCKTYAEAIVRGEEKSLTKCVPGGKETARKLKELVAATPPVTVQPLALPPAEAPETKATPSPAAATMNGKVAQSRAYSFSARLLQSSLLNQPGSEKETRFVSFDLTGSGISYEAGDALGVYPENCPELVENMITALKATGDEHVNGFDNRPLSLREALLRECDINKPTEDLLMLLAKSTDRADEVTALKALVEDWGHRDVLDLLQEFPCARPAKRPFVRALTPLQPRLYSISSSLNAHPNQVHLTVGTVRYRLNGRGRKGVASTFLADRAKAGQNVKIFVQTAHGFRLPPQLDTPIIMVGPGTGIAPFRAFLEERRALGATGKNWLFFGDQRSKNDFLYREELEAYMRDGVLTHLDTAFSRDQEDKIYVQHRMLDQAEAIWAWLQEGAYFYVCGDAKRMARDVDLALNTIVAEQGKMGVAEAKAYVTGLTKAKRYLRDVY